MTRIFVYGTLKRGFSNHERCWLDRAALLCEDVVAGYTLTGRGAPIAIVVEGGRVYGEVYDVDAQTFARVEALEAGAGYQGVTVQTRQGPAMMYVDAGRLRWFQDEPLERHERWPFPSTP